MNENKPTQQEFIFAARDRVDGLIRWKDHIEKALTRNGTLFSYTECCQGVLAGRFLWFDNEDSFAVIEVFNFAKGTTFHIIVAGGDYPKLCELENTIVAFAQSVGAKTVTALGRGGFKRKKHPGGWRETNQNFYIKEL